MNDIQLNFSSNKSELIVEYNPAGGLGSAPTIFPNNSISDFYNTCITFSYNSLVVSDLKCKTITQACKRDCFY